MEKSITYKIMENFILENDHVNIDLVNKYLEEGWIKKQKHPDYDIFVLNYTYNTEFESKWDEVTNNCRGLVIDEHGTIVARAFPKFHNQSHHPIEITDNMLVMEKLDGSLILVFKYNSEWITMTKGSFISVQAEWAKELLKDMELDNYIGEGNTAAFELIHPENRIVVDYKDRKELVFLGEFYNGKRLSYSTCQWHFTLPKIYPFESVMDLYYTGKENFEGYVIVNSDGIYSKVKLAEYMRLHRIVTNTTSYDIWEHMKIGGNFEEILERVPDEFLEFVHSTREKIKNDFDQKLKEINDEFKELVYPKEFALKVMDNPNKHLLFKRLNSYSKEFEEFIWDSVKPVYEKAFTNLKEN